MSTDATPKLLLNVREAADALSVSPRTLWSMTSPRGPVPAVRLGSRVLYSPDALRRWIADQEKAAPAPELAL